MDVSWRGCAFTSRTHIHGSSVADLRRFCGYKSEEAVATGLTSMVNHEVAVTSVPWATGLPRRILCTVGHGDGSIRVWDVLAAALGHRHVEPLVVKYAAHRKAVTVVAMNKGANLIVSAGRDNNIVVFDVTSEVVAVRFEAAHDDTIAALTWLSSSNDRFVSAAKDGVLKVWSVRAKTCFQVIADHGCAVRCMTLSPDGSLLLTGAQDEYVRCYAVNEDATISGLGQGRLDSTDKNAVDSTIGLDLMVPDRSRYSKQSMFDDDDDEKDGQKSNGHKGTVTAGNSTMGALLARHDCPVLTFICRVSRNSGSKTNHIQFSADGLCFAAAGAERLVDIYALYSRTDAASRRRRRAGRLRRKAKADNEAPDDVASGSVEASVNGDSVDIKEGTVASTDVPFAVTDHVAFCGSVSVDGKVGSFSLSPVCTSAIDGASDSQSRADANGSDKGPRVEGGMEYEIVFSQYDNMVSSVPFVVLPGARRLLLDDPMKDSRVDITQQGHRTDVKSLCMARGSDEMCVSVSAESVRVWNLVQDTSGFRKASQRGLEGRGRLDADEVVPMCARVWDLKFTCTCGVILPGDRYVAVGTHEGKILLLDITSGAVVDVVDAHRKGTAVHCIAVFPDGRGVVTGGSDREVHFWDFEMISDVGSGDETSKSKKERRKQRNEEAGASLGMRRQERLGMSLQRTMTMTHGVLSLVFTPDGRYIAASLLDNSVKVFFADSLKFYLSLYGHTLPVLTMAVPTDSTMIVTASADKSVRIWGLDFGDCHKILKGAHGAAGGCTGVCFLGDSHLFMSSGRDGVVKYWDGDSFEMISEHRGHHGDIWTMCGSNKSGSFVVTASSDRTMWMWRQSSEILFLDEEKKRRLETHFDDVAQHEASNLLQDASAVKHVVVSSADTAAVNASAGVRVSDVGAVSGVASSDMLSASERLLTALDVAERERASIRASLEDEKQKQHREGGTGDTRRWHEGNPPESHRPDPELRGRSPSDYVRYVLSHIPMSSLHQVLRFVPMTSVKVLIEYLCMQLERGVDVERGVTALIALLKQNLSQIRSSESSEMRFLTLRAKDAVQRALWGGFQLLGTMKAGCHAMQMMHDQLVTENTGRARVFGETTTRVRAMRARHAQPTGGAGDTQGVRRARLNARAAKARSVSTDLHV